MRFRHDTRKAELEIQIRKNPADFGIFTPKPTESTVRAALRSHDELVQLKARMLELEGQRRSPTMYHRFQQEQPKIPVDEKLQQKLLKAQESGQNADAHVDAIRAELDTYRMLTIILVNRSVSASLSVE